jgi:drug/metabolite transporter (DMT)-like permease
MPRPSLAPPAALIPGLFVVIWATGFITARLVAPHAEPLAFVAVRVVVTALVLAAMSIAGGVRPPPLRAWRDGMIAGVLMQGIYIAGVFWSVRHGLPAGIAALVGSLQPLLTAAVAGPMLGERIEGRRWAGIGAGFVGAGLVLAPKLGAVDASGIPPVALGVCFAAMVAMTFGTLWQKRTGGAADPLANTAIQFTGASLLMLPLAALAGDWHADVGWPLILGFTWSVLGNSVAGILLLTALIRRGAVAGVASLLFLVPPVSAVMAYLLFGEALSPLQIAGMAVAAAGVAIASRR